MTVASPHGCQPCHPTGDSGVTQIGNRNSQDLTVNAGVRAIEPDQGVDDPFLSEAMAAWARKAPERVAAVPVRSAWGEALAKAKWSSERMARAVTACVARDPDFDRGKAVSLHRWLSEERWRSWDRPGDGDAATTEGSARATWTGPEQVRAVVEAAMGPRGVVSYLDAAGWDAARSVVLARTTMAATRLRDAAGRALTAIGVGIELMGSAERG